MVEQPEPFNISLDGPAGPYELSFRRNHDEGEFKVTLGELVTTWHVEVCERDGGGWRLAGLTKDTAVIWGDTFWFEVRTSPPVQVAYAVRGLVRTDGLRTCARRPG